MQDYMICMQFINTSEKNKETVYGIFKFESMIYINNYFLRTSFSIDS